MELLESNHLAYIAASYGWGVLCLGLFIFTIIRQRLKLRALAHAIKEQA